MYGSRITMTETLQDFHIPHALLDPGRAADGIVPAAKMEDWCTNIQLLSVLHGGPLSRRLES